MNYLNKLAYRNAVMASGMCIGALALHWQTVLSGIARLVRLQGESLMLYFDLDYIEALFAITPHRNVAAAYDIAGLFYIGWGLVAISVVAVALRFLPMAWSVSLSIAALLFTFVLPVPVFLSGAWTSPLSDGNMDLLVSPDANRSLMLPLRLGEANLVEQFGQATSDAGVFVPASDVAVYSWFFNGLTVLSIAAIALTYLVIGVYRTPVLRSPRRAVSGR